MIRVNGLSKRYGDVDVLDGVDFHVREGERVAVLGMNGAGKTTLFRALLSLTSFEGGIEVAGLGVRDAGLEVRSKTGYVPQRPPVSDMPLRDFVILHAGLRAVAVDQVSRVLGSLGLSLDRDGEKPLAALSGGMLQKALLALALASGVPVLLLDEPTANLDPVARDDFLATLADVERSTTVLLASHRLQEVESVADRVLVLHDGRVAFSGGIEELRRRTGAVGRLWVELPAEERPAALEVLEKADIGGVRANGRGLWVEIVPGSRGRVVSELAAAGFTPGDLRTVDEPLTRILSRLTGPDTGGHGDRDAQAVDSDRPKDFHGGEP